MGRTVVGKQADTDPPQAFPFPAERGRCYRISAEGDDGIADLDVAMRDSNGTVLAEDSGIGGAAIVLAHGAVCFKTADAATVVVAVGKGGGSFALQIWAD